MPCWCNPKTAPTGNSPPRSCRQAGLRGGNKPGFDDHGHGTHVASIAAGSEFNAMSGVAPDARLVLVKTDFIRLAEATKWCFDKAAGRPAVVNMSLGGHHGGHDGATREERAMDQLSGPGRIIVAAAGNERADNIHIGTRFAPAQSETAIMDISTRERSATIVCWYNENDVFDVALISPSGQVMAAPALNNEQTFVANGASVRIARIAMANHQATEVLINVRILPGADFSDFQGWKVRVTCSQAALGRFDAWITGQSRFRELGLRRNCAHHRHAGNGAAGDRGGEPRDKEQLARRCRQPDGARGGRRPVEPFLQPRADPRWPRKAGDLRTGRDDHRSACSLTRRCQAIPTAPITRGAC